MDHEQGMKFALDIAKGMEYLHSLDQLIPRLYLKSTHIMVSINLSNNFGFCDHTLSICFSLAT